jgi:hypothetical protein
MVARARSGGLVISFYREGLPPEHVYCQTGDLAWQHAVHLLARRETLQPSDILVVRRADEKIADEPPLVPEGEP